MDKAEREGLRELASKATVGPWGIVGSCHRVLAVEEVDHNIRPRERGQRSCGDLFPTIANNCSPMDSYFIAAARTALPALLDALDAAEARAKDLSDHVADMEAAYGKGYTPEKMRSMKERIAELEAKLPEQQIISEICAERERQVAIGYNHQHDDQHHLGQLASAAAFYASCPWDRPYRAVEWPFDDNLPATPSNEDGRRDQLVKAGALIVAEIMRIDRAKEKQGRR